MGFSLVESLISVVLLTSSIAVMAVLTTNQMGSNEESESLSQIENAISLDLGWLKTYAKYWRMSSGPYNLTAAQTLALSFTASPGTMTYEPPMDASDASRCQSGTTLTTTFISDAGSNASDGPATIEPARPFPVAIGKTRLASTDLPSGVQLYRNITAANNLAIISYSLEGDRVARFSYQREVSIRPEAASWCS